jgi:hypothetical protein
MANWEEAIMTYQNYLNYHALHEFTEARRDELLEEAQIERLRSRGALSAVIREPANLLLHPAQALAALILSIIQR